MDHKVIKKSHKLYKTVWTQDTDSGIQSGFHFFGIKANMGGHRVYSAQYQEYANAPGIDWCVSAWQADALQSSVPSVPPPRPTLSPPLAASG